MQVPICDSWQVLLVEGQQVLACPSPQFLDVGFWHLRLSTVEDAVLVSGLILLAVVSAWGLRILRKAL